MYIENPHDFGLCKGYVNKTEQNETTHKYGK